MWIRYISDENPLVKLMENPYEFDILNKETDFNIEIIESNLEERYIVFKRRFDDSIGYVLIFDVDKIDIDEFRKLYEVYKSYCGIYSNYRFNEFELVIIAREVDDEVLKVVEQYNEKYIHRHPIMLVINKLR